MKHEKDRLAPAPRQATAGGSTGNTARAIQWAIIPGLLVALIGGGAWLLYDWNRSGDMRSLFSPDVEIPELDLARMFPQVAERFENARTQVLRNPRSHEAWGGLAMLCDAHEQVPQALTCYRKARELAPDDFRWAYHLGYLLELEGAGGDEVVALFSHCARRDAGNTVVQYRLGEAYSRRSMFGDAERAYRKALQKDPDSAAIRRSVGQLMLSMGKPGEALEHLEWVATRHPDDRPTQIALASAYRRSGNGEKASACARRAATLEETVSVHDPIRASVRALMEDVDAIYARARRLLEAGDYANAVKQFEQVAGIRRDDAITRLRLAAAYLLSGDFDASDRSLKEALELAKRLDDAPQERMRFKMALVKFWVESLAPAGRAGDQARLRTALEQLDKLVDRLKMDLDAHARLNWGSGLLALGEYDSAIKRFEDALEKEPSLPDAHYNIAICYEYLGRMSDAIAHYQKAVALDPQHQAKRRLAQLQQTGPE